MKRNHVLIILVTFFLMLFAANDSESIIYSELNNTAIPAWSWDPTDTENRIALSLADFKLMAGDDIDALSLGNDYEFFDLYRKDIYAVSKDSAGISGDLLTRSTAELPVERDIYMNDNRQGNVLKIDDLISQSMGGGALDEAIDWFDADMLNQGDLVYFSLAPGSPSLRSLGVGPSDVLVTQYATEGDISFVSKKREKNLRFFKFTYSPPNPV